MPPPRGTTATPTTNRSSAQVQVMFPGSKGIPTPVGWTLRDDVWRRSQERMLVRWPVSDDAMRWSRRSSQRECRRDWSPKKLSIESPRSSQRISHIGQKRDGDAMHAAMPSNSTFSVSPSLA